MLLHVSSCPKLFFSDDFIQAQQQSVQRWAEEDVVSVVLMESDSYAAAPLPAVAVAQNIIHPNPTQMGQAIENGFVAKAIRTDFYPTSPLSTTETESSGSVMAQQQQILQQQQRRVLIDVNGGPQENITGRYPPSEYKPEYKH